MDTRWSGGPRSVRSSAVSHYAREQLLTRRARSKASDARACCVAIENCDEPTWPFHEHRRATNLLNRTRDSLFASSRNDRETAVVAHLHQVDPALIIV